MERGKKICRLLFGTVDEFRECSSNFNDSPPAEVAKVTLGQLRVLKAVYTLSSEENNQGIMLKTLAAKINLTAGAASIIVDSLVRMKLLDRLPDENDRRAVKIRLSPYGAERFQKHFDYFTNTMDKLLSTIPEEEYQIFEKVLIQLGEKVSCILEEGKKLEKSSKKGK